MFTINLKEVELEPRIAEERTFDAVDTLSLVSQALSYVQEKYPGVYPNPITLERKLRDAVRDFSGKSSADRLNDGMKDYENRIEKASEKSEEVQKMLDVEFQPKHNEIESWYNEEWDKVQDEYEKKNLGVPQEESLKLEEEKQLKIDNLQFEKQNRQDTLRAERSAREQELLKSK